MQKSSTEMVEFKTALILNFRSYELVNVGINVFSQVKFGFFLLVLRHPENTKGFNYE